MRHEDPFFLFKSEKKTDEGQLKQMREASRIYSFFFLALGIDRENRFFHIEVTFQNLRHPKLFIKDEFLELKDGNFFANLQTILPTYLLLLNAKAARSA